jgi:hypothetical protein
MAALSTAPCAICDPDIIEEHQAGTRKGVKQIVRALWHDASLQNHIITTSSPLIMSGLDLIGRRYDCWGSRTIHQYRICRLCFSQRYNVPGGDIPSPTHTVNCMM